MDRPSEIKMDNVWSLCKDCWSFNEEERPSFTEIREKIEKIIDRTQRRLPRLRIPEYLVPPTSEASFSSDTGYTDDTCSLTTNVYYGYMRPDTSSDSYGDIYG